MRQLFGELGQRGPERFGGAFARAARVYRETLAPEGHRNYPLRQGRALRTHSDLLLPLAPFLDEWGERVARWPPWGGPERAAVVGALLDGCRRIPGQSGYFRALAGLERELSGGLERLAPLLQSSLRRELRSAELRRRIAVSRASFEASLAKQARRMLGR